MLTVKITRTLVVALLLAPLASLPAEKPKAAGAATDSFRDKVKPFISLLSGATLLGAMIPILWLADNGVDRSMFGGAFVVDNFALVLKAMFNAIAYVLAGGRGSRLWELTDVRAKPANPEMVAKTIAPDFGLGPHTASLGLVFYTATAFPASYRGGAFIGQHGSWNRKPLNGYRVVFIPFANGRPQNAPQAFLTGFLNKKDEIQGRPVGVVVDKSGGLLVADDVGGVVWRVTPTPAGARAPAR